MDGDGPGDPARPGKARTGDALIEELARAARLPAATARLLHPRSAFSVAVASCRAGGRVAISLVRRNLVDFCLGNVRLGLGDVRTRGLHDCPGCGRGPRRRRLSERRRGQSLPGQFSGGGRGCCRRRRPASTAASAATVAASAATRPRRATARSPLRSTPLAPARQPLSVGGSPRSPFLALIHASPPGKRGNEIVRKHAPHAIVPQGTPRRSRQPLGAEGFLVTYLLKFDLGRASEELRRLSMAGLLDGLALSLRSWQPRGED